MRATWIPQVSVYTRFHHFCEEYWPSVSCHALATHWYLPCEGQHCTLRVSWQRYQWIMQESTLRTASEVLCLLTLLLVNWTCGCAWLSLFKWICRKWNWVAIFTSFLLSLHLYELCDFSPSLSLPFCLFTSLYMFLSLFSLTKPTKLPPTSSITHTSLLLSSHFWPSPCFPFTPLLYCSPGLQLLGNSWLSMRGMQLTN